MRIAVSSTRGSPTASMLTSTPRPSLISLTVALTSCSVACSGWAPNDSATASRSGTVSIASTWAAPVARATCTAHSPTGPESEHRHQVTRAHAAFLDRVEPGAHHVAGEQRHLRAHVLGHAAQDEVGVWDQGHLGLGSLQRPERGPVAEGTRVHTTVEQAPATEEAVAVGGLEAAQHTVADRHVLDLVAGCHHPADVLVPDREAGLDLDAPVVDVEVRPAHPAELDLDHRVGGRLGLRLGSLLERHHPGCLERDRAHGSRRSLAARRRGAVGDLPQPPGLGVEDQAADAVPVRQLGART